MQKPGLGPGTLSFKGPSPGIFCCVNALGLCTYFDANVQGCPGLEMVTGQSDTDITFDEKDPEATLSQGFKIMQTPNRFDPLKLCTLINSPG